MWSCSIDVGNEERRNAGEFLGCGIEGWEGAPPVVAKKSRKTWEGNSRRVNMDITGTNQRWDTKILIVNTYCILPRHRANNFMYMILFILKKSCEVDYPFILQKKEKLINLPRSYDGEERGIKSFNCPPSQMFLTPPQGNIWISP